MSSLGEGLRESAVVNLSDAVTLVIDDSHFALELTTQALAGFGIKHTYSCTSAARAMEMLKDREFDLIIVDCEMPEMDGYSLVRWLRRSGLENNHMAPVIMTAAHVRRSRVAEARDCGANFVVTKPFSASTLLERIVWVAKDSRPFLEVGDYLGPDRRFNKKNDPPGGVERRADVLRRQQAEAEAAGTEAATDETKEAAQ